MSPPSGLESLDDHTITRKHRLSSLNRHHGPTNEGSRHDMAQQEGMKHVQRAPLDRDPLPSMGAQRPSWFSDRPGHTATAFQFPPGQSWPSAKPGVTVPEEGKCRDPRETAWPLDIWHAMARFVDEVSSTVGTVQQEDRSIPQAKTMSDCWADGQLSTHARRSSEWETETLMDHHATASYPCPFRKRNPARFNVREHRRCAMAPFGSILELKYHIISCHKRKSRRPQCRRCKLGFDTELALEHHLLLPRDQMCEVQASPLEDPESGITEEIERILMARDATGETWGWEGIWRLVFPDDVEMPEPDFQPVVELAEVEQAFEESQEALKASLRETLGLLLPGVTDNDYLNFLTGQLELVFETHRVNIMKQSASRSWSATGGEQLQGQGSQKRPDRKSKRNTLLKSIQRSTQDVMTSTTANKHFRTRSTRDTTASFSERISRRNITPQTDEVTISHEINNPGALTDSQDTSNPRDSCDSGIGIPCNKCNTEQCRRSEDRNPKNDKSGTHTLQQETKETNEKESLSQNRPRLSIKTEGNWDTEFMSMEGSALSGGRFSPESFKQRLLRKQFTCA